MRGRPLTPEQVKKASEVFERTGNSHSAAEAIGSDRSSVRRKLIAAGEPQRAALHQQACEKGLREGRAQLAKVGNAIETLLAHVFSVDLDKIDPKTVAMLSNALNQTVQTRILVAAREDARRNARATREKTRAETRALHDDGGQSGEFNIYFAPPPGAEPEEGDGIPPGDDAQGEAGVEVPVGPDSSAVGDLPV